MMLIVEKRILDIQERQMVHFTTIESALNIILILIQVKILIQFTTYILKLNQ